MEGYVRVANASSTDQSFTEIPLEEDDSLMLSTVQSHFSNAIGLKYLAPSGAWRGLRVIDNIFEAPSSGWGHGVYYITEGELMTNSMQQDKQRRHCTGNASYTRQGSPDMGSASF